MPKSMQGIPKVDITKKKKNHQDKRQKTKSMYNAYDRKRGCKATPILKTLPTGTDTNKSTINTQHRG